MHENSYNTMADFKNKYLKGKFNLKVLDLGSLDINGSYKPIFYEHEYKGLDIMEGKNVDIKIPYPYQWDNVKKDYYDVIVSGQTLEHIEDDMRFVKEAARVLKPEGIICFIAPSTGPLHMELDYRRYTVETLSQLAIVNGLTILECNHNPHGVWQDITLIAQKPLNAIKMEQPNDEPATSTFEPPKRGRPSKIKLG